MDERKEIVTNDYNPLCFTVGKNELSNFIDGEKKCYLLTNGMGGFSSLTSVFSCSRHDHGLFISSKKAPAYRIHMVTTLEDSITYENQRYDLYSQSFAKRTDNVFCGKYLQSFSFQYLPKWSYKIDSLEVEKEIVYVHEQNTVAVKYTVYQHSDKNYNLTVTPLFRLCDKDDFPSENDNITINESFVENCSRKNRCYFNTNGKVKKLEKRFKNDLFFEYDAKDGRDCIGKSFEAVRVNFEITNKEKQEFYIIFSDSEINVSDVSSLFLSEINRQKNLIKVSDLKDKVAQTLVIASDHFVSYRKSTNGKTLMAGYPFFADWGRDTMISLLGCVLASNRFSDCKSILKTFAYYEKKGMMPNVFPEGENDSPMYNTVDASLLFINSVYEYFNNTNDKVFLEQMYSVMESIIQNYRQGTDFHIKMDEDGLITSGEGLEQLTWMDVRFGDILPTPRQGKAVEINAYWYNALKIMSKISKILGKNEKDYEELAENKVKKNFLALFWNEEKGCLKDVISVKESEADCQIRPNQVWCLSLPFCMIDKEKALKILNVIYTHLYTPWGLRSLSIEDKNFHKTYGGSHFDRDMAYHQGTVWAFPLGAYYLSVLRFCDNGLQTVKRQLENTMTFLNEGCLGQIAEIYDGENPCESQGCFAQAWSVGEILRVYKECERMENNND